MNIDRRVVIEQTEDKFYNVCDSSGFVVVNGGDFESYGDALRFAIEELYEVVQGFNL